MIYLLIAILCGALFSAIFKICQRQGISTLWVILFNYITGAVVSWGSLFIGAATTGAAVVNPFIHSWVWLGLLQGALFLGGFAMMSGCTMFCGVALTNVAARSSLILPVIFSWLLLSQPAPAWLPVILVIVSLMLIALANGTEKKDRENGKKVPFVRRPWFVMLMVFLFYGISDFSLKLVQNSVSTQCQTDGTPIENSLSALTGTIFLMAALLCIVIVVIRPKGKRPTYSMRGILAGIVLGLANLSCTACMLRSLNVLPTGTFYPLYNIGVVLVGMFAGVVLFKERLHPLQYVGLFVALVAILLFFR